MPVFNLTSPGYLHACIFRFLHDHSHYAVAQKKYVFIYDRDGVELHCLKSHVEPTRLEFLPYHWLLASIARPSLSRSSFPSPDILFLVGQCGVSEIPRYLHRPTCRRAPHQARRMHHRGAERTQRGHLPRPSERVRNAADAEPAAPCRAGPCAPWPCGGAQRGP